MPYASLLREFVEACEGVFGENLTGAYLHGSMAMGCFHPLKSDIDLLAVLEEEPDAAQKRAFMERMLRLDERAPAKGLELSVLLRRGCRPFVHPARFVMHYSRMHRLRYLTDMEGTLAALRGTDRDLAAHVAVLHRYGRTLAGAPIGEVFGPVRREDYLDALLYDAQSAREDVWENPMYVVLSLCRVLAFASEGLYLSKEEGARWAMAREDAELRPVIARALHCYASDENMQPDATAAALAERMLAEIDAVRKTVSDGKTNADGLDGSGE